MRNRRRAGSRAVEAVRTRRATAPFGLPASTIARATRAREKSRMQAERLSSAASVQALLQKVSASPAILFAHSLLVAALMASSCPRTSAVGYKLPRNGVFTVAKVYPHPVAVEFAHPACRACSTARSQDPLAAPYSAPLPRA